MHPPRRPAGVRRTHRPPVHLSWRPFAYDQRRAPIHPRRCDSLGGQRLHGVYCRCLDCGIARVVQDRAADGPQQRLAGDPRRPEAGVRPCDRAHQCGRRRVRPAGGDCGRRHGGRSGDGGGGRAATRRDGRRARHRGPEHERQRALGRSARDRPGRDSHRKQLRELSHAGRGGRRGLPVQDSRLRCLARTRPCPRGARAGFR